MGRLNKTSENNITQVDTTSGKTNLDIHIFIDEYGNVTQIEKKKKKNRLKYYIDPGIQDIITTPCVIGINDAENGDCSYGIGLGLGDDQWGLVNYE